MKKLVRESLYESVRNIFDEIVSLGKELGYKAEGGAGGMIIMRKRIKGGELVIDITERAKTYFKGGELLGNMEESDPDMITFAAHWSPEKKILGKYRNPNYKMNKTLNDVEEIDFGKGLFSTTDSDILEQIKEKILEIENNL